MTPLSPLSNNPLISIIVANYNYGAFLEETLLSIIKQDYQNLEILIIDGGSKDNSLSIIKKFAQEDARIRWVSEPDGGHMPAVNKGLKMTRGELIGVQHSTDTYQPGALREAVQCFLEDSQTAFVGGAYQVINSEGFVLSKPSLRKKDGQDITLEEILNFSDYPAIVSSFFRRDLLLSIDGFYHSCHTTTYLHYFLEAWRRNLRLQRVSSCWGNYREHSHTVYVDYNVYKFLTYSKQRQWACETMVKEYAPLLSKPQRTALLRSGVQDELFRRIRLLHQSLGLIPCLLRFLYLRGSLQWVLQEYYSAFKRMLKRFSKKVFLNKNQEVATLDSRWYIEPPNNQHIS